MQGLSGNMLICLLSLIGLTGAATNLGPVIGPTDVNLCEDTPVGHFAFKIDATDPENDPLTYQISGEGSEFFRMDSTTGIAVLSRPINKDEIGSALSFPVTVSDPFNTEIKQVIIIIIDANNNAPQFDGSSYDHTIPENTTVGSTLFTVRATDQDTGNAGIVSYSIDNVIPISGMTLFKIDSSGNLILNGTLSFTALSPFYQLRIKATDNGGKCFSDEINYQANFVNSLITVGDVPNIDPQFTGLPYRGRVTENIAEGVSVLQVTATDPDTGINAILTYSIEDTTAEGLFEISADTGLITVSSAIDREKTGDVVTLTVKATESIQNISGVNASSTTQVQIEITDVNDEKPEFYRCEGSAECVRADQFTAEVLEHSSASISFNMFVKDADRLPQTRLQLEGTHKNLFSVVPELTTGESPVQLHVKLPQELDYEALKEIVLQVIATDVQETTFTSTATATIKIIDANDMIPQFNENTYRLNVAENSPNGTEIQVITATDPDTMDKDKIVYRLLPDSILPYFDVQPATGLVYVKDGSLLDREGRSLYTATLQASDTDGKAGTTLLEITLTDVNDEYPVINRETYNEFVAEGQPFEMVIQASDADEPNTNNSQIVFAIQPSTYSGNFTIDPDTGVLRNNSVLDREDLEPQLNGKIELNVTATDKGTPPLSDSVKVIIEIEDVNDNTPEFNASSYTFSIKEGQKGAHVGSVYAVDLDQTEESNRITFSIAEGSFGSFIIRSAAAGGGYRGDILVDPDIELDYESARTQFALRVEATDLGGRRAEATVVVNVLDVNDERPVAGPVQRVAVKENILSDGIIANFTGSDRDGNHSLVFELESMQCRCNASLTPCHSFVLEPTGAVRVAPSVSLDFEECDQAVIEARVVDELTEKGENASVSAAELVITIEDVNDNAPEFIASDSLFVVVSESASRGTSVAHVTATDKDSGANSEIRFEVTQVQFVNLDNEVTTMRSLFEAVTTQQNDIYVGIIQTTESLDITLRGKYLVAVKASDPGDLSSNETLEIFSVDASFKVELEFTLTVAEVEQTMDAIVRALTSATDTVVEVVSIRPKNSEARNSDSTIVAAYFIYPNGTALTSVQVERMLSHPDHYLELRALGLTYIGDTGIVEPPSNTVQYILLGIMGGLLLLVIVLSVSLMCTRRSYKRKLKASKAFNSAMDLKQQDGPVVPGTNKFSKEGTNPVLNVDFNTTPYPVLRKNSDADTDSINSKESVLNMDIEILETRSKSDEESDDDKPPNYYETLETALAERDQKKKGSKKPKVVFINPALSTTDL